MNYIAETHQPATLPVSRHGIISLLTNFEVAKVTGWGSLKLSIARLFRLTHAHILAVAIF